MAALTVTCHLMGPLIILHTEPLLTVLMALMASAEDLVAEDLAEDSASAEAEDGGEA